MTTVGSARTTSTWFSSTGPSMVKTFQPAGSINDPAEVTPMVPKSLIAFCSIGAARHHRSRPRNQARGCSVYAEDSH